MAIPRTIMTRGFLPTVMCLLVAGTAAAQQGVTSRQMAALAGLYQVKAESVGQAIACLRPQDTNSFYEALAMIRERAEAGEDPAALESAREHINEVWSRATKNELCGLIQTDAILKRWDSSEEYPELIGVRNTTRFGRTTGRTYWTRKDWLEIADAN